MSWTTLCIYFCFLPRNIQQGLCDELQNLRKSQVPEGFEVALRSDSEFEVPLQPELKSYNPDTSRMTTKIAVVDSSLSESPKLPQIYFPVSERSSEALMDERVMMERQSERPSQDSNECSKVPSRRISIHSTESAKNAMKSRRSLSTAKLEIENPVQSYSISGINRKDEKLFRVFGGVLRNKPRTTTHNSWFAMALEIPWVS